MLTEDVTVYCISGAGPLAGLLAPEDAGGAAAGCVRPPQPVSLLKRALQERCRMQTADTQID